MAIFSLLLFPALAQAGPPAVSTLRILTPSGERALTVEIADTPEEQQRGLQGRIELETGHGMLFIREEPSLMKMWMEETYMPLDMLFINEEGVIHHIAHQAKPRSRDIIAAETPSIAVLEIPGGAAKREGIEVGDRVKMEPYFP